jgi:hypothetical protein
MMPEIVSRPYSTAACCEKCVFGRGEHAEWCCIEAYMPTREQANAAIDECEREIAAFLARW